MSLQVGDVVLISEKVTDNRGGETGVITKSSNLGITFIIIFPDGVSKSYMWFELLTQSR